MQKFIIASSILLLLSACAASQKPINTTEKNIHSKKSTMQVKVNNINEPNIAKTNFEEGQVFLANNKNQPGVVTLPSGLQYKIITPGYGQHPNINSAVTVNYQGAFINGETFDSSYKRGMPVTFSLKNVIAGWQEALPLMKVGSTWDLFIPANLAYGKHAPSSIGSNKTLIFRIELVSVDK